MNESIYSRKSNAIEGWVRASLCDICRRYVQIGTMGGGAERIEGTMFCPHCDALGLGDCRWPASQELIAAWRDWAERRAEDWRRVEDEARTIREWRWAALAHDMPLGLPVGSSGARMTARVIG
jgi:hypothetical protein